MSKHTEGPWKVGHDGRGVARVYAGRCEIVRALSEHGVRRLPKDERAANRDLIAAAPCLLKAAKAALTSFDEAAVNALIEAVAKAEGGQ